MTGLRSRSRAVLPVLVALAVALLIPAWGTGWAAGPPMSRQIQMTEDSDYFGRDIQVLKEVDLETCKSACIANRACKAFTYNAKAQWCFLKDQFRDLRTFPGAISGRVVEVRADKVETLDRTELAAARAAELAFLSTDRLKSAEKLAKDLTTLVPQDTAVASKGLTRTELIAQARAARGMGNGEQAVALAAAALRRAPGQSVALDPALGVCPGRQAGRLGPAPAAQGPIGVCRGECLSALGERYPACPVPGRPESGPDRVRAVASRHRRPGRRAGDPRRPDAARRAHQAQGAARVPHHRAPGRCGQRDAPYLRRIFRAAGPAQAQPGRFRGGAGRLRPLRGGRRPPDLRGRRHPRRALCHPGPRGTPGRQRRGPGQDRGPGHQGRRPHPLRPVPGPRLCAAQGRGGVYSGDLGQCGPPGRQGLSDRRPLHRPGPGGRTLPEPARVLPGRADRRPDGCRGLDRDRRGPGPAEPGRDHRDPRGRPGPGPEAGGLCPECPALPIPHPGPGRLRLRRGLRRVERHPVVRGLRPGAHRADRERRAARTGALAVHRRAGRRRAAPARRPQ